MILGHLDDRKYAIEKDPRSPGGQGYTGLEALLQYVYDQTTSTAVYDQNSHIFKVALFASECANYADAKTVKDNPSLLAKCGSFLGPDQPGITTEDITRFSDPRSDTARDVARRRSDPAAPPKLPAAPSLPVPAPKAPAANEPAPSAPTVPGVGGGGGVKPPSVNVPPVTPPATPGVPSVPNLPVPCVPPLRPPACTPNLGSAPAASPPAAAPPASTPPVQLPGIGRSSAAAPSQQQGSAQSQQLLDYLLKPMSTVRRNRASVVASPVLVGAVTVLVIVVAVFLAYNANSGLPFVPTTQLKVDLANGANLVPGNEVRSGGFRVGVVSGMQPVALPGGKVGAQLTLKLDRKFGAVPADSHVTVRPRSALGLKYVELDRGRLARAPSPTARRFPSARRASPSSSTRCSGCSTRRRARRRATTSWASATPSTAAAPTSTRRSRGCPSSRTA